MRFREGKVPPVTLAALAVVSILVYIAVEYFQVDAREKNYREKKEAVSAVRRGQDAIRAGRKKAGLDIHYDQDPSHSGLIGVDDLDGPLTTDKGYLRPKQISTHPNLAAVVVGLLREAGVGKDDVVAVGMTGSFPGANLATICAIEALGAKPIVITSLGSSTFGANEAQYTWLDMEKAAFDAGAIRSRSIAASIGGEKDKGTGLNKSSIELARKAIQRNGVEKIEEKTLVESIAKRMDAYARASGGLEKIACYVNIGGGLASVGSNQVADRLIGTGLTKTYVRRNYPTEGVLLKMLKAGKPVIHLKDFRKLAEAHGLPPKAAQPGEAGEGPLFISRKYNLVLVLGALAGLIATISAVGLLDLRHALFGKHVPSKAQPRIAPPDPGNAQPPKGPDPGETVL